MPGLPLETGDPLNALEEMLTKLVLFGLLGVLIAAWRLPPRTQGGKAALNVALAIAKRRTPGRGLHREQPAMGITHTPCITDVLLGGLGSCDWRVGGEPTTNEHLEPGSY